MGKLHEDQMQAIEAAHNALFKIDLLLAETYSPAPVQLEALHDELYQARAGLEATFGVEMPEDR